MRTTTLTLALPAALWLALACPANAQWSSNPNNGMVSVTNEAGTDNYPLITHLGSGYSLVAWLHVTEFENKIKYQVLDQEGHVLLAPTGADLFDGNWQYGFERHLISDGVGGAICIVSDRRSGYKHIYGQRFDALGNPLWGAAGLPLAEWPGLQDMILYDVAANSNGEFFFSWNFQDSTFQTDLYVQKVDTYGNQLWGNFGVAAATGTGDQAYSEIVPDNTGGILVLWEDNRANPYTYYLYMQHLDVNGNPLLAVNGIPVIHNGWPLEVGGLEEGVPDGRGGGIWVYTTPGWDNSLMVTRINGQGQLLWLWISPYYANHYIEAVKRHSTTNTVWICASDNRPGAAANYLYQFDIRGNALFGSGGLPYGGSSLVQCADGMIVIFGYQVGLSARRVNFRGRVGWDSPVALSAMSGAFNYPVGTSDGADGAVVAFQDRRYDIYGDISAQRVRRNGRLGNPGGPQHSSETSGLRPMVLGSDRVQFILPRAGQIKLELFDLLGRRVAILREGFEPAGMQTILLDNRHLPSGIYLLRLEAGGEVRVGKIALIK